LISAAIFERAAREVLDPEQNQLQRPYVEVDFDLSDTMFIATRTR